VVLLIVGSYSIILCIRWVVHYNNIHFVLSQAYNFCFSEGLGSYISTPSYLSTLNNASQDTNIFVGAELAWHENEKKSLLI